jgi:hypothetical protein
LGQETYGVLGVLGVLTNWLQLVTASFSGLCKKV